MDLTQFKYALTGLQKAVKQFKIDSIFKTEQLEKNVKVLPIL